MPQQTLVSWDEWEEAYRTRYNDGIRGWRLIANCGGSCCCTGSLESETPDRYAMVHTERAVDVEDIPVDDWCSDARSAVMQGYYRYCHENGHAGA